MSKNIYLDNNATTQLHPEVVDAMSAWWHAEVGNPSSQHSFGRRTRRVVEDAREFLASALGAHVHSTASDRLVFCSSGTEANNLAVLGLIADSPEQLLVSSIEHPSIHETGEEWRRRGRKVEKIEVDAMGRIRLDSVGQRMDEAPTSLVCCMLGNHETGVLQPVEEVARIAELHGSMTHCDAVQVVGKREVHFRQLGVTSLSFAPHKFHGPCGIAGLLVRHGVQLRPILFGGFQQFGIRPGTEPAALVVGFRRAFEISRSKYQQNFTQIESLRDWLERQLMSNLAPAVVHGQTANRLPHVINISFPGVNRQALVMALDLRGIALSTGSACQSGSSEPSHVLIAMGVPQSQAESSIRISLSCNTSQADVEETALHMVQTVNDLRRRTMNDHRRTDR